MPSYAKIMATMALALLPLAASTPVPTSAWAVDTPLNSTIAHRADVIIEPTYEGEQDFKDAFDDLEAEGEYELITEETEESALVKRGKKRFSGTATWFRVGQGHCGWWNKDSDLIVALPTPQYKDGRHCGRWVRLCSRGKCANAQVVDSCPTCSYGSLDLSPRVFKALAPLSKGVAPITWSYTS